VSNEVKLVCFPPLVLRMGFENMKWACPYIDENHRGDAPKGADVQALQRTAY